MFHVSSSMSGWRSRDDKFDSQLGLITVAIDHEIISAFILPFPLI